MVPVITQWNISKGENMSKGKSRVPRSQGCGRYQQVIFSGTHFPAVLFRIRYVCHFSFHPLCSAVGPAMASPTMLAHPCLAMTPPLPWHSPPLPLLHTPALLWIPSAKPHREYPYNPFSSWQGFVCFFFFFNICVPLLGRGGLKFKRKLHVLFPPMEKKTLADEWN